MGYRGAFFSSTRFSSPHSIRPVINVSGVSRRRVSVGGKCGIKHDAPMPPCALRIYTRRDESPFRCREGAILYIGPALSATSLWLSAKPLSATSWLVAYLYKFHGPRKHVRNPRPYPTKPKRFGTAGNFGTGQMRRYRKTRRSKCGRLDGRRIWKRNPTRMASRWIPR